MTSNNTLTVHPETALSPDFRVAQSPKNAHVPHVRSAFVTDHRIGDQVQRSPPTVSDHRVRQMRGRGLRAIHMVCEQADNRQSSAASADKADVVPCDRLPAFSSSSRLALERNCSFLDGHNLKTRLRLIISSLTVLLVLVTGFVFMTQEKSHLLSIAHQQALSLVTSLAVRCREPLLLDDVYKLYNSLTDFVGPQAGHFSYVVILDQDGNVVMHSNLAEVGKQYIDAKSLRALQASLPEVIHFPKTKQAESHDHVISPIIVGQVRLGTVLAGHSHSPIEAKINKVERQIFFICLLAIIIGLLLANFLAAWLSAPLRQLTEATERIALGERDLTVDIVRNDEFGTLARAFQHMVNELKKTTVSRDSIQNILDSAGDAIRFIDKEKRTVRTNRAMMDLLGQDGVPRYSGQDGVGRCCSGQDGVVSCSPVYCSTLLKGDFCDGENCLLRRIEKGEEHIRIQARVTMQDGRSIFASIIATPVFENGKMVGIIESIQDISDWKKAEEERRMIESQFLQAQKMEVVGRLASGVAHDFNNILTVIMGYTGIILQNSDKKSPAGEMLQIIFDSSEKAAALTRQLLAFSRKQVLSFEVVDLQIVISQLIKMLQRLMGDDIKIIVQIGAEVSRVFADRGQIEQILMNLAVNARDAMPKGGEILIKIENCTIPADFPEDLKGDVPPVNYVLLSVTDNGVGMPKEIAEHIFMPFFTTKDKGQGTGLGLSTVYNIVRLHKGHITVNSEPGHGTTFNIYLPASSMVNPLPLPAAAEGFRHGNETILVVDDNETVRIVCKEMLSPLGYTIVTAGDAQEALDIFGSRRFDLIITDLNMPGQTGFELAHQAVKLNPEIKIIFMSGYLDGGRDRDKFFPESIYLQKPLTIKAIMTAISATLDSKRCQGIM